MAVLTAQGISSVSMAVLSRSLVLPRTVTVVPGDEFAGSNGDTISIRVPQPTASQIQASPGASLTPSDVDEVPVALELKHVYHLKNLTDQEVSMDLEDFAGQVSAPQTQAVARGVENLLIGEMNNLTPDSLIEFAYAADDDNTREVMALIREYLTSQECPASDRYLAASPEVVTRLLRCSDFTRYDASGSADALRNALVGRIYGLEVVEVSGLDAGTAVGYHKSAFGMAVRTPVAPRGASESASVTQDGIGIRQVFQYDAGHAQDQSLVSTFAGASTVWEDGDSASDNARFICVQISPTT